MSPVAAPADRRFRRAHVKPGRRRRDWRRVFVPAARYAAIALVVGYGAYRGSAVAAHAHVLQIDRIIVRGNERLSTGEVLALLGGMRGESLLWVDLDEWRNQLLATPWVRDATIRRSLPSTIEVAIRERQPMAIGRMHGDMYLVDDTGAVIDQYGPEYADLDLPIVDGLPGGAADGAANGARAELAGRVIAAVRSKPEIARRLSQIDVSDEHNAAVILSGDPAVIHLGDEQFLPRLQAYLDLSPTLHERVPDIDSVDLRFDDRIYVRPAGKPAKGAAVALASRGTPPAKRQKRTSRR